MKKKKYIKIVTSAFFLLGFSSYPGHATSVFNATISSYPAIRLAVGTGSAPLAAAVRNLARLTVSSNLLSAVQPSRDQTSPVNASVPVKSDILADTDLTTGSVRTTARTTKLPERRLQTAGQNVFGSVAISFRKLGAVKKASATFAEIAGKSSLTCAGTACVELTAMASESKPGTPTARQTLNQVNHAINHRIAYRKDSQIHGRLDVWSTPSQTLARGTGDCEDYALLKMAVLAQKGVPLNDMAVVILYDRQRHFYHAVLSVRVNERHYILDNMRDAVLADSQLPSYQPLFSISNSRGFLHGVRNGGKSMAMKKLDSIAPGEGGAL